MNIDYTPIDYNTWDFSGQGKNILPLLTDSQRIVWERALPYQDTRKGEIGHAEMATYLAIKFIGLLRENTKLDIDEDVVIAGIINHDIGWSQVSQAERDLFYVEDIDPKIGKAVWERYEPILRERHQEIGTELARDLLKGQGDFLNPRQRAQVYGIIFQHDTGKEFLSVEDGIVKSADRAWRYTLPCVKIAREEREWSEQVLNEKLEEWLKDPNFLYHDIFREAAMREGNSAMAAYNKS
jgi:hypothetical protein